MQQPSILFVVPWKLSAVSGVDQVVINLARQTRDAGRLRPVILCNDWEAESFDSDEFEGIPLFSGRLRAPLSSDNPARNLGGFALRMRRDIGAWSHFFKAQQIRVVNAHYAGAGYALFSLLRALRRRRFRLVYSLHGPDLAELQAAGAAARAANRWILRQADQLVCCSESLAGTLHSAFRVDARKVCTVLHGVDPETLSRARQLDYLPDCGGFDNYLVSVGGFTPDKDHETLLEAYLQLVREGLKSALVMIGRDTPHLARLRSRVRHNGLQRHVFFITDLDHARTLAAIHKARLLVQASRHEAFGLPLIEAAYLRTPVVATQVGGIPEVLGGYYPYLVKPGDAAALAQTIDDALFNPTETDRQVRLLKRRVATRFTWQRAYGEYEPLWLGRRR